MSRLWIALLAAAAMGQTGKTSCDAALIRQTNPGDVDRYMERGGRCEGLYAEQVSSIGYLLVESLTAGTVTPNAWTGQPLTLQCRYKEPADVHIQAFILQPRPFYRLDAIQRGSAISWNWDTEVIQKHAKPGSVGVVAWTSVFAEGRPQRVYLPLRSPAESAGSPVKLIVITPVAVSEAYLTLAGTAPGERPLRQQTPVGKGSYLKNQRIEIELPRLPREELYRVEVTARGDVASVSAEPFLIYGGSQ